MHQRGDGLLAPVEDMRGPEDVNQQGKQKPGAYYHCKSAGYKTQGRGPDEGINQEEQCRGGGAAEDQDAGDAPKGIGPDSLGALKEPEASQGMAVVRVDSDGDEG